MDVEIHPNAKKHLTEKQVLSAWLAVTGVHSSRVEGRAAEMACDWMAPRRTKRGACRGRACPWVAYHSCLVSSPEDILAGD